jgi:LPXTG-site transpeptidase (sortase) family protein
MIHPGIRLSKDPATQSILVGSDASFTLTVTNTGDVPLSDVAVSDAQCDSLTGPTGDTSNPGVLDTTETWIYSCTVNGVTTDFTNSASVHGTPPLGSDVNASDSADVTVNKADITVVTDIHNSSHDVVTTVPAESSVHDSATLTFAGAAPTGTVDFLFYSTDDCSGMSVVVGSGVSISDGFADSSVNEGPLSAGSYSFKAHYSGDANYVAKDGACEPLTVTPLGPFDPPFGIKTVNAKGLPILTWTMVWINNANHVPIIAAVHDPIPNGSTYVGGSLVCTPSGTSSTVPVPPSVDGCYFEAPSGSYPRGRIVWTGVIGPDFGATSAATAANELTITYSVTVDNGTNRAVNIATIDSDLNGDGNTTDPGEQRVASARSSWSRTGEPIIPVTGFAPGRTTVLPPLAPLFKGLGDITLEVPSLGINIPVVGIPQVASNTWDVSWLGKDAGWLAGSAFPTWDGNSVLTAHVYDANGNPGPFVNVYKLKWGDRVIIEAWGTQYTYEVREVLQVNPDDVSAMMKHQTSPWLTLVTCRGYDESLDSYLYRVLVRAVLVSVK